MPNDPALCQLPRSGGRLFADQVHKQYDHIVSGSAATLINGLILVLVLRGHVPTINLAVWFSCAIISSAIRLGLNWCYRRSSTQYSARETWNGWFIATLLLAGVLWGSVAIFLFPAESVGHQAFIALVTGGMVAGAVGAFTAVIGSFFVFSIPALLPVAVRFFSIDGELYLAMGGMILLFLLIMSVTAIRMHKDILHLLALKYERTTLIADLEQEVEQRKAAQDDLRRQKAQVEEIVTERTIQLRKSEEKYRELVENINDVIFVVDREGTITYISPVIESILGYGAEELIGKELCGLACREDQARLRDDLAASAQVMDGQHEYRLLGRSGEIRWCRVSARPIAEGRARLGTQGVLVDITLSKRLAEQLQRAQKMEALGILAGGVAHDLNNILSGIVSYPELLLMDLPKESPLWRPLHTIKQSGENAAAIVQDLLSLARRGVPVTEAMNMNRLVEQCLASPVNQALFARHPDIRVATSLTPDLLNIFGSSLLIMKSLSNLLANAVEAMPGGGRIEITTANCYADSIPGRFDTVREGEYVVLTVADTGIPIPESDRTRIFEPFYTRKVMGRSKSGLGMAVVWGMIKDHHGYIDLQSEEGRGTRFELFFPATREQLQAGKKPEELSDIAGNGEFILVVDDMEAQREIATQILQRLGYRAKAVASGEEAMDFLRDQPADLVVLDMIMAPGIDGYETFRQIKDIRPEQQAIIASGYSETEQVRRAQELGAGRYIKKPYTLVAFGRAIKERLQDQPGVSL